MSEEYAITQREDGSWGYNTPPVDDLREALRLCQEENARLKKEKSTQTIMAEIAMKIYETLERMEK